MCKGLIADIQHGSLHDGPGFRTTVFLKGCPLSCVWCHNPECISTEKEELFYPEKCIGCGHCKEGCWVGARVTCGTEMTAAQVLREVLADRAYYAAQGGITLSGGEPLLQNEFSRELLWLCKQEQIHTAIETSLYRFDYDVLSLAELIIVDIKVFDREKHKKYTGVDNQIILENIKKADALGKPLLVRTPIIPGINDDKGNIIRTREFVEALEHAVAYRLLPYHPLGLGKAKALGKEQKRFEVPTREHLEVLKGYAVLSR